MARLRVNNLGDPTAATNPVSVTTAGAMTWTSAPTNMPAVSGGDTLAVTLQPGSASEQIVTVTAHTAGASTATCSTTLETGGTLAAVTSVGWVHAPTAADFAAFATTTLTRTTSFSSAGFRFPVLCGATFTPTGTTHTFTFSGAAQVLGGAKYNVLLLVGTNGGQANTPLAVGMLNASSNTLVPAAGASLLQNPASMIALIGSEGAHSISGELTVTGLTPGTVYTVQALALVVSGAQSTPIPASSNFCCEAPDKRTVWVATNTNSIIPVTEGIKPLYTLGLYQDATTPPAGQVAGQQYSGTALALPAGAVTFDICCAPSGTSNYGIVTNYTNDTATVFNWSTKAIVGTTASLGSIVTGCCIEPTGTTAYVSTSAGTVVPITLATAAVGTPITVASGKLLEGIAVSHDGLKLWVANYTDGKLHPITLSGLTVGAAVTLNQTGGFRVKASSDNTMWVADNNVIQQVNQSGTILQTFDPAVANGHATGFYGAVTDIAVNHDGTGVFWWTASTSGQFDTAGQGQWYPPGAVAAGKGCLSQDGYDYIYQVVQSGSLQSFPSGSINISDYNNSGFFSLLVRA